MIHGEVTLQIADASTRRLKDLLLLTQTTVGIGEAILLRLFSRRLAQSSKPNFLLKNTPSYSDTCIVIGNSKFTNDKLE